MTCLGILVLGEYFMLAGFLDVLDLMLPLSTNKQSWGGDLSLFAKAVP
jgi:hypothetical protein